MDQHLQGLAGIVDTTVGGLLAGDMVLTGFKDRPTVKAIQPLGPVTIIDMQDGTATAPVPTGARVTVRRVDGEGDWECYGCGYHVPTLIEGFGTRCPICGSYELHLSDDAKARRT
jgi:lipopolysaccharide biosynthesis regulator YciM